MMPSSMETIHYIVHMLIVCLMAPSLPKTLQLNTTILETVQFGFTMQEQRHKRLLIRILPSTEVSNGYFHDLKPSINYFFFFYKSWVQSSASLVLFCQFAHFQKINLLRICVVHESQSLKTYKRRMNNLMIKQFVNFSHFEFW